MAPIIEGSEPPKIAENVNKPTPGMLVNMVIFANKVIKVYPEFREFHGMDEVIEHVMVNFARSARRAVLGATQFAQYRCLRQGFGRLLFW
ncbi:serine protein kinase PrkA [Burkholderia lata]|uniref:Serine protein kinase, PrkA n=1 Tax=Burkholderia lata (strain ATCC 17760 / DSM 23089 / LMG 22485 / NCIMB 9086 / R18194 / 383) TaxID=482957 RepID=Q39FD0_BURL3|nr:serine protein kinase PrkA [Burkholderia lata]ABB08836.1 putative serine protein kinase, PrkA [Burkholderia lata]